MSRRHRRLNLTRQDVAFPRSEDPGLPGPAGPRKCSPAAAPTSDEFAETAEDGNVDIRPAPRQPRSV
jgi:hypothetical protein